MSPELLLTLALALVALAAVAVGYLVVVLCLVLRIARRIEAELQTLAGRRDRKDAPKRRNGES